MSCESWLRSEKSFAAGSQMAANVNSGPLGNASRWFDEKVSTRPSGRFALETGMCGQGITGPHAPVTS